MLQHIRIYFLTRSQSPSIRSASSIASDLQRTMTTSTSQECHDSASGPARKKMRRGSYVRRHALVGSSVTSTASLSESTASLAALKPARKIHVSEDSWCSDDKQQQDQVIAGLRSSLRSKNNTKRFAMMLRGIDTPRNSLSIRSSLGANFLAMSIDE